jgi:hypothetical protein
MFFFSWSLIMLALWGLLYWLKKDFRKIMLRVALFTFLFGFTEFLFVPEYWLPPTLFGLAAKIQFDIESFIFSFAIGGIGAVLYRFVYPGIEVAFSEKEKIESRHRIHRYVLLLPLLVFLLLAAFTKLNHIYCGIISLFTGALATLYCRPDLKHRIWISGIFFTLLYFIFFGSILLFFPLYVKLHWNLAALTSILITGIPLEELLFAFTFGMYWAGLYEHVYWVTIKNKSG